MGAEKSSKRAATTGIIAAIAASSCCIPPIIAALAGIGGISSSLSWMNPARPYLIGLAIVAIGYVWYAHLRKPKIDSCGCSVDDKPKWFEKRAFLVGITLFSAAAITFPYYSGIFYPKESQLNTEIVSSNNIRNVKLEVSGMTCESCEHHIDFALNKTSGVIMTKSSYEEGLSEISYDQTKTDVNKLIEILQKETGYSVTHYEFNKHKN